MRYDLPDADWFERAAFFLGYRDIFLVEGDSMLPHLKGGDKILFNPEAAPRVGDIVFASHPVKKEIRIVKRVAEITSDARYFLLGDNADESEDSRVFGTVSREDILGVAVCRYE